MLKPNETFVRTFALDLLVDLRDLPHINKEKLFADAVGYYRWQFTHEMAAESLPLYKREFAYQHGALLAHSQPEVQAACFIRWFVENRFHEMLPLITKEPDDEIFQRTRFSSPSFSLPTADPMETYLIQWIYWFLDTLPTPNNGCCEDLIWAEALVEHLNEEHELPSEQYADLIDDCRRFFRWCWTSLRSWKMIMALLVSFFQSTTISDLDPYDYQLADAHFITWFCANDLDHLLPSEDEKDDAASASASDEQ